MKINVILDFVTIFHGTFDFYDRNMFAVVSRRLATLDQRLRVHGS